MYHTTGLEREDITDLCACIRAHSAEHEIALNYPPRLGWFRAVCITVTYLSRNRVQVEIVEAHGVSQSTISRCVSAITPLVSGCLQRFTPWADELDGHTQYIANGTLVPCWSWRGHPELYSGKHKTTGYNLQVVS